MTEVSQYKASKRNFFMRNKAHLDLQNYFEINKNWG